MVSTPFIRQFGAVFLVAAFLVTTVVVRNGAEARQETRRWASCLDHPWEECRIPSGYGPTGPCPEFEECWTTPSGVRYLSASLRSRGRPLWNYYDYAVIALDAKGKVRAVEVKRRYATF